MKRSKPTSKESPFGRYQQLLQARKAELESQLGFRFDTIARMGRVAEEDQAQLSHEEFISLRRNSMDYAHLRLVEEALERVEMGEYGVCEVCSEPIPPRRLDAVPWAKNCVTCQERLSSDQSEQYEPLPSVLAPF